MWCVQFTYHQSQYFYFAEVLLPSGSEILVSSIFGFSFGEALVPFIFLESFQAELLDLFDQVGTIATILDLEL